MKKETIYQNFWDTAKAVLRRESTAINAFQGEKKKSQINNSYMCRLNKLLLNSQQVNKEMKQEIKNTLKQIK